MNTHFPRSEPRGLQCTSVMFFASTTARLFACLDCSRFGKFGWIPACPGIWRLEILWQNSRLCGMLTNLLISFVRVLFFCLNWVPRVPPLKEGGLG
jgi:hypothetical protein